MSLSSTQTFPGTALSRSSAAQATARASSRPRAFDWQRLLVLAVLFIAPVAFILLYTPPDRTAPHEPPPAAWAERR